MVVLLLSVLLTIHAISYNIAPSSFGLPIFWCPLTSILHVLITTSSSVFLSTHPNHLSLGFQLSHLCLPHLPLLLFLVPVFLNLFIPIIHLNILISVLSRKPHSPILSAMMKIHDNTNINNTNICLRMLHTFI